MEKYICPEIDFERFRPDDIIASSGENTYTYPNNPESDSEGDWSKRY